MSAKAFVYAELQLSVPFAEASWRKFDPSMAEQPGFLSTTWLADPDNGSVGGFYGFDSFANARRFATGYFPSEASRFGMTRTIRVFRALAADNGNEPRPVEPQHANRGAATVDDGRYLSEFDRAVDGLGALARPARSDYLPRELVERGVRRGRALRSLAFRLAMKHLIGWIGLARLPAAQGMVSRASGRAFPRDPE